MWLWKRGCLWITLDGQGSFDMTEEQKKRLGQRLRELKEKLEGKTAPTVEQGALLTELQPGYLEVLMRRFRP